MWGCASPCLVRGVPALSPPKPGSAHPRLGWLLQKKDFPSNSFYVVVVVKTEDEVCGGELPYYPFSGDALPGMLGEAPTASASLPPRVGC